MAALLDISDFQNGKILYVLEEGNNQIVAYFYNVQNYFPPEEANINDAIAADFNNIFEEDELENIGHIAVADQQWLEHIEVNPPYRGIGIGTNLVRLAIDHLELNAIACVREHEAYEYSLTPAGEGLIAHCTQTNPAIVTQNMCFFSGHVPLTDEASGDPGLDCHTIENVNAGITSDEDHNYSDGEDNFVDYDENDNEEQHPDPDDFIDHDENDNEEQHPDPDDFIEDQPFIAPAPIPSSSVLYQPNALSFLSPPSFKSESSGAELEKTEDRSSPSPP
jgi:GNAT superfamily N-acetyltransferase